MIVAAAREIRTTIRGVLQNIAKMPAISTYLVGLRVGDSAERTGTGTAKASDLADLVCTRQPDKVRDAVLSGAPKDPGRPSKVLFVVDQFEADGALAHVV
jgi:hypothetical protein